MAHGGLLRQSVPLKGRTHAVFAVLPQNFCSALLLERTVLGLSRLLTEMALMAKTNLATLLQHLADTAPTRGRTDKFTLLKHMQTAHFKTGFFCELN